MNKERIKRLEGIAKEAGIDIKILHHKNVNEEEVKRVAEKIKLDERINVLGKEVSEGRITDKDDIRAEIDHYLGLLWHTLEINHLPAADKALEARNLLTEPQRIKISPNIRRIYDSRARIRTIAETRNIKIDDKYYSATEVCKKCGGGCCGRDIEKVISEMDFFYMFYVLRDEQINKIWKILKKPDKADSRCRFQGEDSCIIPAEGRPDICYTHYCEKKIPIVVREEIDLNAENITEESKKLQKKLRKERFDLKTCD